jgi:uncharacterized membrane protein SpoIIM required for sporulation
MDFAGNENAGRTADWQRLEELCSRATASGLGSLNASELWEFPSLYRRVLADVSLLRSSSGSPAELQRLNHLCNRAHAQIYSKLPVERQAPSAGDYILFHLPAAAQRRKSFILAASAVLLFFALVGWIHAAINPDIVESIMPPQMYRGMQAELATAREQADLRLAAQIKTEDRPSAAIGITLNNVRVSAVALTAGILGGVPTLLVLAFNGYMVGVIGQVYASTPDVLHVNLPLYFAAGIAPHGGIELPAICVAGAAGMLIGFSWLFPGALPRGESLRSAVPDALRLLLISALTLLVAGAIEGFITPLYPPTAVPLSIWFWGKIAFGLLVFAGWLTWLANPAARAKSLRLAAI